MACHLTVSGEATKENYATRKPLEYELEEYFWARLPCMRLKPLPQNLLVTCKCAGRCPTQLCRCRLAGAKCLIFCHGKKGKSLCHNLPLKHYLTLVLLHLFGKKNITQFCISFSSYVTLYTYKIVIYLTL